MHSDNLFPASLAYLFSYTLTLICDIYISPGSEGEEAKAASFIALYKLHRTACVRRAFAGDKPKYRLIRARIQLINQAAYDKLIHMFHMEAKDLSDWPEIGDAVGKRHALSLEERKLPVVIYNAVSIKNEVIAADFTKG